MLQFASFFSQVSVFAFISLNGKETGTVSRRDGIAWLNITYVKGTLTAEKRKSQHNKHKTWMPYPEASTFCVFNK